MFAKHKWSFKTEEKYLAENGAENSSSRSKWSMEF